MQSKKYTPEEIALFNSKLGKYSLLRRKKINSDKVLEELKYLNALKKKQEELIKLQNWVIEMIKK
jgi:hypothetical protein